MSELVSRDSCRCTSIAVRRAMVASHGARSRPGSTVRADRQAFRNVCCAASSASCGVAELVAAHRVDQPAVLPVDGADRVGVAGAKSRQLLLGQHPAKGSSARPARFGKRGRLACPGAPDPVAIVMPEIRRDAGDPVLGEP